MAGLFVQKHADAVRAQGVEVRVIHSQTWRDMFSQWKQLRREGWMPDIVQLNVIQKQGLLALYLKRCFHIPYIIVEHWSGYLPENGQYMHQSGIKRKLCEHIAAQASLILPVSNILGESMRRCGIQNSHWQKINNVVDDFFYQESGNPAIRQSNNPTIQQSSNPKLIIPKTLLHVSCFDERAKNVKGLLRAAKILSQRRQDWILVLVGTGIDYADVRAYAKSLLIPDDFLRWTGELTSVQVAEEFYKADIFILPSNYENAPVVLSESLATGTPVIATRAGGMPEMISKEYGILVPPRNDQALADAMDYMLDHYCDYDTTVIRKAGEQYSFAAVGKQLKEIYTQCLVSTSY